MKRKHLTQFGLGILLLIVLNVVAQRYFFRLDLTEEKRYTLSEATKNMLRNLEGDVYVKVYLEGDMPAGFQRLKRSIQETLDEFMVYAGDKLDYRFIDPQSVGASKEEQNKFMEELYRKGIIPNNIFANEGEKKTEKLIFPGALITYTDPKTNENYEVPAMLFKVIDQRIANNPDAQFILNQSVENVEYNLISGIHKLTQTEPKRVGFIVGHGELENIEMATAITRLREFYEVVKVPLPLEEKIKEGLDAIIVAKPDSAFTEEDKYKIDQYIMQGGKALFFVDVVGVHMDSVIRDKGSFTFPFEHNLLDMFFRYGVRLNNNLIKDLQAGLIPVVVGRIGEGQPNIKPIAWHYYPLLSTFSKHPIVRNLGPVQSKFISTIDTVKAPGVTKTPLAFTSKYSQIRATPAFVEYEEMRPNQNPDAFNQGSLPVAYLLEGSFSSVYKSRSQGERKGFLAKSKPTKILICSDGDLIRNEVRMKEGQPEPVELGFEPFLGTTFANADFLINALNYMVEDGGIITARNREVVLRPLDKTKLQKERSFWQIYNIALPILMILLLGLVMFFLRRRFYAR